MQRSPALRPTPHSPGASTERHRRSQPPSLLLRRRCTKPCRNSICSASSQVARNHDVERTTRRSAARRSRTERAARALRTRAAPGAPRAARHAACVDSLGRRPRSRSRRRGPTPTNRRRSRRLGSRRPPAATRCRTPRRRRPVHRGDDPPSDQPRGSAPKSGRGHTSGTARPLSGHVAVARYSRSPRRATSTPPRMTTPPTHSAAETCSLSTTIAISATQNGSR
jgi:hypothetical protein